MTIVQAGHAPPKPRGRSVVALTITVTRVQRTALEMLADAQQRSISAVVRQFIADGLGTDIAPTV